MSSCEQRRPGDVSLPLQGFNCVAVCGLQSLHNAEDDAVIRQETIATTALA